MNETDIARPAIAWLQEQHWDIYQEVQFRRNSNRADIVAVRNGILWILECKRSLTIDLLDQASRWMSHYRSVVVPQADRSNTALRIARDYLKVGVIEVNPDHESEVYLTTPAPLMRQHHRFTKEMISQLQEEHKTYLPAGSAGGGYYTPYRSTIDRVKAFIYNHPGSTMKEIFEGIHKQHHYSTDDSALGCLRKALLEWETDWCFAEMIDGKWHFSPKFSGGKR